MSTTAPERLGKYKVRALLGQGAMGKVYQCHDPDIDRMVAIKVIHPHVLEGRHAEEIRERFRREARAAARCQHPNIVTIYELGQHEGCDYIVMEYVQGEELRYFLERGEAPGDAERLYIVREVLSAVGHAHAQGVVHRDIKPANIMLMDDGGVKVADFGVAHLDQSDLTVAGSLMGTPVYMAPEGLRGEPVGPRADLYSVGMVTLELFTGRKPVPEDLYQGRIAAFIESVLESSASVLPPGLDAVLRRALAALPSERFSTAAAFLEALDALAGEADRPPQETLSETVMSREPLPVDGATLRRTPVEWPLALIGQVRELLAEHVGPLAGMLVDRAAQEAGTPADLGERLADNIPDPSERARFLACYRACAAAHWSGTQASSEKIDTGSPASRSPAESVPVSAQKDLDEATLEALGQLLAHYMGPLAGSLVRHHGSQGLDRERLLRRLADQIPDSGERRHFLEQARNLP